MTTWRKVNTLREPRVGLFWIETEKTQPRRHSRLSVRSSWRRSHRWILKNKTARGNRAVKKANTRLIWSKLHPRQRGRAKLRRRTQEASSREGVNSGAGRRWGPMARKIAAKLRTRMSIQIARSLTSKKRRKPLKSTLSLKTWISPRARMARLRTQTFLWERTLQGTIRAM